MGNVSDDGERPEERISDTRKNIEHDEETKMLEGERTDNETFKNKSTNEDRGDQYSPTPEEDRDRYHSRYDNSTPEDRDTYHSHYDNLTPEGDAGEDVDWDRHRSRYNSRQRRRSANTRQRREDEEYQLYFGAPLIDAIVGKELFMLHLHSIMSS